MFAVRERATEATAATTAAATPTAARHNDEDDDNVCICEKLGVGKTHNFITYLALASSGFPIIDATTRSPHNRRCNYDMHT